MLEHLKVASLHAKAREAYRQPGDDERPLVEAAYASS